MTQASAMLDTYPTSLGPVDRQDLAACIESCFECAQACTACADVCLSQHVLALTGTVRSTLNCADVCVTTGRILSRYTGLEIDVTRAVLEACIQACMGCVDQCEEHAYLRQCAVCAHECRRCEQACRQLLAAFS